MNIADRDEADPPTVDGPSREAEGMVGVASLALAALLAALLPLATSAQPEGKAWFLSPRNTPIVGIAIVALSSGWLAARLWRGYRTSADRRAYLARAFWAFGDLGPAIGYTILFCLYLFAISWLGFALSTLFFGQACLWFSGLRGPRWMAWNLVFTVAIVLILRVGMGLWFPYAAIFSWLPGGVGNVIGPYL